MIKGAVTGTGIKVAEKPFGGARAERILFNQGSVEGGLYHIYGSACPSLCL